jgi:hypothetical protein
MSVNKLAQSQIGDRAVLLRDDPDGVLSETTARRIQETNAGSFMTSLNRDWAAELDIDSKRSPTSHYFLTGAVPVVVTGAAIVIQPNGGEMDGDGE